MAGMHRARLGLSILQSWGRRASSNASTNIKDIVSNNSDCSRVQPYIVQPSITMETPRGNVAAHVLQKAQQWGDKIAVECSLSGKQITYSELVDLVARCGSVLKRMGVGRRDIIALTMANCPEYPVLLLGALSIGATATVLNSSYTYEEVAMQLKNSQAKVVIADVETWAAVSRAMPLLDKPLPTILNFPPSTPTPSGHPNLQQLLHDPNIPFADMVEVEDKDLCFMPYSSGTTGNPKGVAISHRAFLSNYASYKHPSWFSHRETTASYQETYLCYLPFFHVYGLLPIICVGLSQGVKLLTIPKFDPKTFMQHIKKHEVRVLHTVPTVLNFLMQSPEVTPTSMASVMAVLCGAAPVHVSAVKALTEKIDRKVQFQEGYGMTEVLLSHVTPLGSDRVGSMGINLPNVYVKVLDVETDELLGPKQAGEICIKSPSVMNGYFNNVKATQETITDDGWVRSGDVGYFDDDKYFSIIDRTKELIKVKALQVSPSELEDILIQHPKVAEVGVVGVPDEKMGEVPRAYIVTKAPATEGEIADFLAPRVAPHKRLAGGVVFIKEMPKNATGKLMRRHLKAMSV